MLKRLQTRYALVLIALVVVVVLLLTLVHFTSFRSSLRNLSTAGAQAVSAEFLTLTRERGEAVADFLSRALVNPLYELDMRAMLELLRDIKALPGVERVVVFGTDGRILHDGLEMLPGYGEVAIDEAQSERLRSQQQALIERSDGDLYVTRAIHIGDDYLGGLRLQLSLRVAEQKIAVMEDEFGQLAEGGLRDTMMLTLLLTLILVVLVLLLAFFIAGRLARPLVKLAEKATHAGQGDYRALQRSGREDEIGTLEQAFNRMLNSLEETTVSRRFVETVVGSMKDGLLVMDPGGRVELFNRAAAGFFKTAAGRLHRRLFLDLFPADARERIAQAIERLGSSSQPQSLETECEEPSGRRIPVALSCSPVNIEGWHASGVVCVLQDISERRIAEARIRQLAQYDPLTGLPNRALFQDRLQQAIAVAERSERLVGVMFLDLDGFKYINDTLGHFVGDQLLAQVAVRLTSGLRKGDTVARLGGDEFVVIADMLKSYEDCAVIAAGLIDSLKRPFPVMERELFLTGSVGITIYPLAAEDTATLLRQADTAMYRAKESGKNSWCLYEKRMEIVNVRRMELEAALRRGLMNDDFELYYQPQVELASGRVMAVEALLRWRRFDAKLLAPADFLTVMEDMGLIVAVGDMVLTRACRQFALWRSRGAKLKRVAVNLSVRQFEEQDLVARVGEVLQANGLTADVLELEITESTLMRDPEQVIKTLRALKARGVQVAIDDFGAGFSSFSYLQQLDVDTLKIDRSLIQQVPQNADHAAIVVALIKMAQMLGKEVMLEGVESAAQLAFAREQGVDSVQGYRFFPALPASEIEQLLRQSAPSPGTELETF
ncbi:MAG: EAL domain-containing protein [Gammaproteobacteria bacterium]|nr:EAL domain-containing protein [Gammaproteobacteria bacterium]